MEVFRLLRIKLEKMRKKTTHFSTTRTVKKKPKVQKRRHKEKCCAGSALLISSLKATQTIRTTSLLIKTPEVSMSVQLIRVQKLTKVGVICASISFPMTALLSLICAPIVVTLQSQERM